MTTKAKELPSKGELLALLDYCPDTGNLTWKKRPEDMFKNAADCNSWNSRHSGKIAGAKHSAGYIQITLNGKNYLAHRLIWVMSNDALGNLDVDHINGCRSDNRLCNLRAATRTQNLRNSAAKIKNKTGVCGVSKDVTGKKYRAYIGVAGKQKHLGVFDNFHDAVAARDSARREYGFTDRHGV